MQHHLQQASPSWYAFCHNDLQYGNMMLFYRQLTTSSLSPAVASSLTRRYVDMVYTDTYIYIQKYILLLIDGVFFTNDGIFMNDGVFYCLMKFLLSDVFPVN